MVDSFIVKVKYCGVNFEAEFTGKLSLLSGYSGTGKTFLINAIELYCLNNKIKYAHVDYKFRDTKEEIIEGYCSDAEVILLDNADLYLTNDLLSALRKDNKFIIMCMKDTSGLDMADVDEYIVNYKDKKITVEVF